MSGNPDKLILVYDRECPMCDAYCRMVRIREAAGKLELFDARDGGPIIDDLTARGLDIDEGMVLIAGDQLYYGSDAIHALSLLSSRSGIFNRLNYRIFKSKRLSGLLYPVLRSGRNLVLKLLGRTRINNLGLADNDRF